VPPKSPPTWPLIWHRITPIQRSIRLNFTATPDMKSPTIATPRATTRNRRDDIRARAYRATAIADGTSAGDGGHDIRISALVEIVGFAVCEVGAQRAVGT
jgi:hypothetical protein